MPGKQLILSFSLALRGKQLSAGARSIGSWEYLILSPPAPLDPSLVAFLRSHIHTREQAGEKATKKERPGGPSIHVTKEEPIMSALAGESRKEDKLEPEAPGLEERHYLLVGESREKSPSSWAWRMGNREASLPLKLER
jgi:hypothetical protein